MSLLSLGLSLSQDLMMNMRHPGFEKPQVRLEIET